MNGVLRFIQVFALGTWVGSIIYLSFVVAPGAFGVYAISAAGRTGLDTLIDAWWSHLLAMRHAATRADADAALP